jgi:hypothetical protein
MKYCPDCGGTGHKLDGTVCACKVNEETIYSDAVFLDMPEQYQGIRFNRELVPSDLGTKYADVLQRFHDEISSLSYKNKNIIICSPARHSKTIWAYSIIQSLFRKRVEVCQLYDIMEIRKIASDIDAGRYHADESIYSAPYMFARVPAETTFLVYSGIQSLVYRRVRRGHSTILLYNGSWKQLVYGDSSNILKPMLGDGAYATLECHSFETL